jgi:membrane-associated phospholipid phosphatase
MEYPLLLNYIGLYSPIILFFLTLFLIRNITCFLNFFVLGFILNNILNILLKLFFKDPRPSENKRVIQIGIENGNYFNFENYGMPSGHAQNCGYFLTYCAFVLQNFYINILYLIITIITILQRYINKKHTILQLIVGIIIGIIVGYITYIISQNKIQGNMKMKPDEDAPI